MKVTIPGRTQHEGIFSIDILISDKCPICGGDRGKPFRTISYDGSRRLHVDGWRNPCGHIDKYDVLREEWKNRDVKEIKSGRWQTKKI